MCACMPVCFHRNLMTFAKARPAQMIFITTSNIKFAHGCTVYVGLAQARPNKAIAR